MGCFAGFRREWREILEIHLPFLTRKNFLRVLILYVGSVIEENKELEKYTHINKVNMGKTYTEKEKSLTKQNIHRGGIPRPSKSHRRMR